MERELLSLLKVENKGWNMTLFNDVNKMSVCLCASCGFVCCDAVELDCDHKEDEDIFLYCKQCLIHLIQQNENKCIINSHINPQITASKANRRQVLKSIVICPYSQQYKMKNIIQQNNNQQIMDTFGNNINDEKEGHQPFKSNDNEKNDNNCEWKGKLTDLINKHISKCAKKNNPTFTLNVKIKNLEKENIKLKNELNAQKQEILRNENVIKDARNMKSDKIVAIRNENEVLRKELAAEKNKSVNLKLMTNIVSKPVIEPIKRHNFITSKTFIGSKKGYCFKNGNQGIGYYIDDINANIVSKSVTEPIKRHNFIASKTFIGSKNGYCFQSGALGLGYYLEEYMDKSHNFISSETFIGSKKGYCFKNGNQGIGYYIDDINATTN